MKRVVVTALVLSILVLPGVFSTTPVLSGSVAYAQVADPAILEQLTKIRMMVADLEMKVHSREMVMSATARERAMQMLVDVTNMLLQMYLSSSE